MEDRIKAYYRDKRELDRLNHNLNLLYCHREEVQKDIDTSNIALVVDIQRIDYDKEKVQTSNTASPQERAVDNAFAKLEQKLQVLDIEILDTKQLIREVEQKNIDMEFLISQLNDEARRFVEMRYKEKRSGRAIELELNLSEASVWRLRKAILESLEQNTQIAVGQIGEYNLTKPNI